MQVCAPCMESLRLHASLPTRLASVAPPPPADTGQTAHLTSTEKSAHREGGFACGWREALRRRGGGGGGEGQSDWRKETGTTREEGRVRDVGTLARGLTPNPKP